MTGRFNDKARRAIDYAVQCARSFGHSYVGSEHLLMGILQVTESTASMLLRERGVRLESLAIIDKFEDGRPIFRQAE